MCFHIQLRAKCLSIYRLIIMNRIVQDFGQLRLNVFLVQILDIQSTQCGAIVFRFSFYLLKYFFLWNWPRNQNYPIFFFVVACSTARQPYLIMQVSTCMCAVRSDLQSKHLFWSTSWLFKTKLTISYMPTLKDLMF